MINQTFKFFLYLHILFFFTTNLFSNTRVAFSRPGSLIRTPTYFDSKPIGNYFFGVSSETIKDMEDYKIEIEDEDGIFESMELQYLRSFYKRLTS